MREPTRRWAAISMVCALVASACSVPAPADSLAVTASLVPADSLAPIDSPAREATRTDAVASSSTAISDDAVAELTGRAVAGIATGGPDVVMRVRADGFRLPENEYVIDLHDDRVLSGRRSGTEPPTGSLVVRDQDGNILRVIEPGMQIPQTAIVRGDAVYFAGVDITYDDEGQIKGTIDRGVWVAHGDGQPEPLYTPELPVIYSRIQLSPDGHTVGFARCDDACTTTIVGQGGRVVEVPKPELILLANDVALVIAPHDDNTNQVIAYAIADGAELWRSTSGPYWNRYETSDGARFVLSASERLEGNSEQLRIDVVDATSGALERTVKLPADNALRWLTPSLSTDRYAAILNTVLPNPDEGPNTVQVVDLEAGELLDLELVLGEVP